MFDGNSHCVCTVVKQRRKDYVNTGFFSEHFQFSGIAEITEQSQNRLLFTEVNFKRRSDHKTGLVDVPIYNGRTENLSCR